MTTIDAVLAGEKRVIFEQAAEMVQPIIMDHNIKPYRVGAPFGHGTTMTEIDQHLDHILRVADWLLEPVYKDKD